MRSTRARSRWESPTALVCQLELLDEPIEAALRQTDAFFCLNTAPARPVSTAILERTDLIVANSLELETLGSSPLGALFAVTLGAEGALLLENGEEVARATPPSRRSGGRHRRRRCLHRVSRRLPARGSRARGGPPPRLRRGGDRRFKARSAAVSPRRRRSTRYWPRDRRSPSACSRGGNHVSPTYPLFETVREPPGSLTHPPRARGPVGPRAPPACSTATRATMTPLRSCSRSRARAGASRGHDRRGQPDARKDDRERAARARVRRRGRRARRWRRRR